MTRTHKIFTHSEIAQKAVRTGSTPFKPGMPSLKERLVFSNRQSNLQNSSLKASGENIDQQIFQDVFSAEDLVLQTARAFIDGPKPHEGEKYERMLKLKDLGFVNAADVIDVVSYEKKLTEQKELVAQVEEYQRDYPLHRFIDNDGVKELCKKYGLLLTGVDKYKADIPEKNQNEVINFRVNKKHIRKPSELNGGFYDFLNMNWSDGLLGFNFPRQSSRRSPSPFFWPEYYKGGEDQHQKAESDMVMAMGMAQMAIKETEKVSGTDLCIVAPERMLITTGNQKRGHILINDPIILQPVKFGYLIITAWGFEAADPAVLNPSHN